MIAAGFPRVPDGAAAALAGGAVRLRAFGRTRADLDVDFAAPRPSVVEQVLGACCEPALDGDALAALPISVRIRALLRVAARDAAEADLVVTCPAPTCGEQLEISLPLERVAEDPERVPAAIEVGGRQVRVPTGRDQRRLAEVDGGAGVRRAFVAGLLPAGEALDDAELPAIEEALAWADPLVDFFVAVTCPACGDAIDSAVDLEGLALERLARAQLALLEDIHRLAEAYHWTEEQVLALPPRRRAWYLARLERSGR